MNPDIVKLNARGKTLLVDQNILIKSQYFKHMLFGDGFQKTQTLDDGSYYVDCDHDAMIELVAYMETGHFKYKTINPSYLKMMMHKYSITPDDEKAHKNEKNRKEKVTTLLDAMVKCVAQSDLYAALEIAIRLIPCACKDISFVTIDKQERYRDVSRLSIGCQYNSEENHLDDLFFKKNEPMIISLLKKYNIDRYVYIRSYMKREIVFKKLAPNVLDDPVTDETPTRCITIVRDNVNETVNEKDVAADEE